MMRLFALVLLFATPALAHSDESWPPEHDKNCPPDCTPGTPEHDVWWCSTKTVQTDCELKDKVNCAWIDSQCKVKP